MNYIDVALIVVIVVIGFRGFASGFIAEFCSLVGILLGVYLGSIFAAPIGDTLKGIYDFGSETIHITLGFMIVLLVCWTLCVMVGVILGRRIYLARLGVIDKSLGFAFASVKVFFIFSFIAYAVSHINFIQENFAQTARENSQVYVNMMKVAQKVMRFPAVRETIENLNDISQGNATNTSVEAAMEEAKNIAKKSLDSISNESGK